MDEECASLVMHCERQRTRLISGRWDRGVGGEDGKGGGGTKVGNIIWWGGLCQEGIGDEVLGGFGGAAKAKKSKNKSQSSRGTSITAEILPSRTVNMRELREHNNRIFRKEKAQREAKKAAWEERNAKKVKVPEAEVTRERSPSPAPSLDSIPEEGSRKRARESEEDDEWSPSPSPVSYGLPDDTHYRNSQPLKRINTEDEEMGRLTRGSGNIEEYLNSSRILCIRCLT